MTEHRHPLHVRLRRRPRLLIAGAVMLAMYLILPASIRTETRALLAWNAGTWLFLAAIGAMMAHEPRATIRLYAAAEDSGQWVLLVVGVIAAVAAVAAIVLELGGLKDSTGMAKAMHLGLVATTILSAWGFIHMMFALHYAAEYYGLDSRSTAEDDMRAGLDFPGEREPGWGDFAYYAFVIGCACATADVDTLSPAMRRTTLVHCVVAFLFNTVILALTINIGAGLV